MNRKWSVLLILLAVLILLVIVSCNRNNSEEANEIVEESTAAETTEETVAGVAYLETPEENPWDGENTKTTEPTVEEQEATTVPTASEQEQPDETTVPETGEENKNENTTLTEYEIYKNMSGAEQKAFMDSFDSVEAFFDWLNAAKEEYEALNPGIEVGDGVIDLGELVGGNG